MKAKTCQRCARQVKIRRKGKYTCTTCRWWLAPYPMHKFGKQKRRGSK